MHKNLYENEFNLHVNEIPFSYERTGTRTCFEKEAKGSLEMATAPPQVIFRALPVSEIPGGSHLSLIISCLDVMFTQNRTEYSLFHAWKFFLISWMSFFRQNASNTYRMKIHLTQLRTRRLYFEQIVSERAAKEAEAEETEKIRVSWTSFQVNFIYCLLPCGVSKALVCWMSGLEWLFIVLI